MAADGDFSTRVQDMEAALARLQAAHRADMIPSAALRRDWLSRGIDMLVTHEGALCDAMSADFGHRSADQSRLSDIAASISAMKHARQHVERWMRAERRASVFPLGLLGAKSELRYQPKGVVGVIAPWNFPVNMVFAPLAGIFAAGNRVMIKPSEFTARTSDLMAELFTRAYAADEVAVVTGGPDVAAAFTRLAFDHIMFTGSTSVGRHVMRAAAENLVPVTLELGGKSPVWIGNSADLNKAAARILNGKLLNAGQICLAPDYVLMPQARQAAFVGALQAQAAAMLPAGIRDNPDYTALISQRHWDRLHAHLEDARAKGAQVVALNPKGEDLSQQEHRKMAVHVLLNVNDSMSVMQEEIFGPLLPVVSCESVEAAVGIINARPRPLALYPFTQDAGEREALISRTISGGVTVNDVVMHIAQEELPFGGSGPSGMGHYHGREGFLTFSHARAVYHQTGSELIAMLRPPYGAKLRAQIKGTIRR